MSFLKWLLGVSKPKKESRKRVFISFAIEDVDYRNYLIEQARKKHSPFEFIDMSVKQAWEESEWQKKCRTKIKRCHGVIVLLSSNTYHSSGLRWEIKCAKEENIPIIGIHIKKNKKRAIPPELNGGNVVEWTWENIEKFINSI
jgi:MTH538 TIR-like domain (DUF1863)